MEPETKKKKALTKRTTTNKAKNTPKIINGKQSRARCVGEQICWNGIYLFDIKEQQIFRGTNQKFKG
jgi:hypothetical protein